jgi:hypothetical protein
MTPDPPPGLKTPDLTKSDAVGFVTVLAAILSVLGIFDMTDAQKGALATGIAGAYAVALMAVDAWRRHGRAKVIAAAVMAGSDPGMVVENLPAPTPPAPAAQTGADFTPPPGGQS